MFRTVIVTLLLVLAVPAEAKLYKCKDADGSIVYTDEPCAGGEELKLPPIPTFSLPKSSPAPTTPKSGKKQFEYTKLVISKPKNDAAIQNTTGKVDILVDIAPRLQYLDGHRITLSLDGKQLKGKGTTTRVQLDQLNPGTHTITVSVVNKDDVVLKTSEPVKFHIRKPSVIKGSSPQTPQTDSDGNETDEQSDLGPQRPQGAFPAPKAPTTLPRIPKN